MQDRNRSAAVLFALDALVGLFVAGLSPVMLARVAGLVVAVCAAIVAFRYERGVRGAEGFAAAALAAGSLAMTLALNGDSLAVVLLNVAGLLFAALGLTQKLIDLSSERASDA
jgi:hypothetical protein